MKNICAIIFLCCFFVSCYDDKGNYDYREINEVKLSLPPYSVRLDKKKDVSVTIVPEISQTLAKDDTQLSFKWEKRDNAISFENWEECGDSPTLTLSFSPQDQMSIVVRLTVTDHRSDGSTWVAETNVVPIKPYNRSWFVLQNDNGKSVLGVVDGEGTGAVVIPDAYKVDMGKDFPLNGTPKMLKSFFYYGDFLGGFLNPSKRVLMVLTEENMGVYDATSFNLVYSMEQLLHWKVVNNQSDYKPYEMWSFSKIGDLFVNNENEVFLANADGFSVFYPLEWAQEVDKREVHITHAATVEKGSAFFLYDQAKHCFLYCLGEKNTGIIFSNQSFRQYGNESSFAPSKVYKKLNHVGNNPNKPNVFDPENLDKDEVILSMERGCRGSKVFAIAYSKKTGKFVVYEFNGQGLTDLNSCICSARYEFDLPGITYETVRFAMSSYGYEAGILFAASGNKVYKVELVNMPRVSQLYEHPDGSVQIKKIKFKYGDGEFGTWKNGNDFVSEEFYYQLGALVDYGNNKGGVLDFRLNRAGELVRDVEIVEHKGFGDVVDFVFVAQ